MSCVNYEKDHVTISKEDYAELTAASNFLNCLYAAGVDNWSGYEEAQQMHQERHGEEE